MSEATGNFGLAAAPSLAQRLVDFLRMLGCAVAPPVVRVALALPFLRSGLTRWDAPFSLSAGTTFLFEEQFRLHVLGNAWPFPFPDQVAYLVASAEIVFPCLLLLGLATRLSDFALLCMTAVIQLVFPDGWVNFHLYWAALALSVMALGPGRLSVDAFLWDGLMRARSTAHKGV